MWTKIKDEVGFFHILNINDNYKFKVEKSIGGDYFISVVDSECNCLDSEVIYCASLQSAKSTAASLCHDGTWKDLL